jgi:acetyl esterase/lipase
MTGSADRTVSTFTYKRASGLSIDVDLLAEPPARDRPVVLWIHGGALIVGNREDVPEWLIDVCADRGFALVSADYRLAPETKLPEIVQDVVDVVGWIRERGPELFGADPASVAVVGESAGGYLTLTTGFLVRPAPGALVSLWGYGDLIGEWYTEPSQHPVHRLVTPSRAVAAAQVAGPPIADDRRREGDGWVFYQYCRQHGTWPEAVSGWDPRRAASRFRTFMPVENVTDGYPPTLLVHGERDTDVPHDRSVLMAEALSRHGIEHELISVPGAEHGLADADPASVRRVHRRVGDFLWRRLAEDGGSAS